MIGIVYAAFRRVGNIRIYYDLVFCKKFLVAVELGRLKEFPSKTGVMALTYEKQLLALQKRRLRSQYENKSFLMKLRDLGRAELINYDEISKVQICTSTLTKILSKKRKESYEQALRITFILKNSLSITYYTSVKLRDYIKSLLKGLGISYEPCK